MKKPPLHLSSESKKLWERLQHEFSITDEAGLLILQTAMEAFSRMRECQVILKKEGLQLPDRFGTMHSHPLTGVEKDSRNAMMACLKALSLDLEPLNPTPGRPGGR